MRAVWAPSYALCRYLLYSITTFIYSHRWGSPVTSHQTWRTCWGTYCRLTWPSGMATWRMLSMTSRITSGLLQQTGSLCTRGRWVNSEMQVFEDMLFHIISGVWTIYALLKSYNVTEKCSFAWPNINPTVLIPAWVGCRQLVITKKDTCTISIISAF